MLSAADLSIARRIAGAARANIKHGLWEDRTLVKAFGVRGTCTCCQPPTCPCGPGRCRTLPSSTWAHPEPVRFTLEQASEIIAAMGDVLADTELTEAIMDRTGP